MSVDLHLHSNKSDGSDDPATLVSLASEAGLSAIALTDHDNLDGIIEAQTAANKARIEFIPGTELSVNWSGRAMHMLVYFLDPGAGPLQDELAALQQGRQDRNHIMVKRLADLGIEISYEEIDAEADGSGIGRPHFAAVLVQKGYVADIQSAFDKYLATGRPAYVSRQRLDAQRAIELARDSRAVPVIAHPHTLGISSEDYREAFLKLASAGLGGIEAYYGEYMPDQRAHLANLCLQLGIAATGGSDYHGRYKKDIFIGRGRGDLDVPDDAIDALLAARDA